MAYDHHNLVQHTVHAKIVMATLHCEIPRRKTNWIYLRLAADEPERADELLLDWAHTWSDHAGGLKGGRCERCGKSLKEVKVRVDPRTGEPVRKASRMAREIASMKADVPPVVFIGDGSRRT